MDKIILGMLMLKRITIYEIRNIIKLNFKSMCSDSMGSIQASIKKLLAKEMIIYNEFVDNGINKKVYSITPCGRSFFLEWLNTPMDITKTKNMELSKLLFMGLIPENDRIDLISKVIDNTKKELEYLQSILNSLENSEYNKSRYLEDLQKDFEYMDGIIDATGNEDIEKNIIDINKFENLTLQLGMDTTEFYLQWFIKLKNSIESDV
jgi:DNA-binding PadR family transcriptional regulator